MSFQKDFDELLDAILTDYRNQFPQADTSQGSLIFIKSACLASVLWGLYKHQDYIADQIFPDTADTAQLEHHAWVRGLTRKAGETDAELLARLLEYIRRPPAGGNKYDYEQWALEVEGVRAAYCVPLAQGLGTVAVVILAAGESEIPGQGLLDEVRAYIEVRRPVTASILYIVPPTIIEQDVSMRVLGDCNRSAIAADINAFMLTLKPGEGLPLSRLYAIAYATPGVFDVIIHAPAANVDANLYQYQMIRPGVISVTS